MHYYTYVTLRVYKALRLKALKDMGMSTWILPERDVGKRIYIYAARGREYCWRHSVKQLERLGELDIEH